MLAGMFLCVPVSIQMMSLYFYAGDPDAGLNEMVFYHFLPEGWPIVINRGLLFWQCAFLTAIISCLVFVFNKNIKKESSNINIPEKIIAIIMAIASVSIFYLWVVGLYTDCLPSVFSGIGLLIVGFLG